MIDLNPFYLSIKLAFVTTVILFCIALPLAWWLSQTSSKSKPFIEALSSLPIILPPSVLGFYLLIFLSQNSIFNLNFAFTFTGLVIASCIYSFVFMLQPLQSGFESINRNIIEASYLSGKGKITTLFRVALPTIKPSLITAIVITFAHTIGEFGVVLMVGGSIPHKTRVASVAIYDMV
jgi:molybdate transport system permease protein